MEEVVGGNNIIFKIIKNIFIFKLCEINVWL